LLVFTDDENTGQVKKPVLLQRSCFRIGPVNGQNGGANLVANSQLELPILRPIFGLFVLGDF
jgi:hypothetical protein